MSRSFAQEWRLWPSRTPKGENGSKSITKLPTASLKNCRVNWTGGTSISLKVPITEDKTNAFEEIVYSAWMLYFNFFKKMEDVYKLIIFLPVCLTPDVILTMFINIKMVTEKLSLTLL